MRDILRDSINVHETPIDPSGCEHCRGFAGVDHRIGDIGAEKLATALPTLTRLQELTLNNNQIGDVGSNGPNLYNGELGMLRGAGDSLT